MANVNVNVAAVLGSLVVAAACFHVVAAESTFPAFNLVCTEGDYTASSVDSWGPIAVKGKATLSSYGAGSRMTNKDQDALIAGSVDISMSEVYGNLVYCDSKKLSQTQVLGETIQDCGRFSFNSAAVFFSAFSNYWKNADRSGSVVRRDEETIIKAEASGVTNVGISSAIFDDKLSKLTIDGPENAFVVVNVGGQSNDFSGFGIFLTGGITNSRVIFNFFDTTSLNMHNIQGQGSVLAPKADVKFNNGELQGSMYAKSVSGDGEFHFFPPDTPPCPPSPCPPCPPVLTPLPDYNAFARFDITAKASDCAGRMAAGRNVDLSSYSIGTKLSDSKGARVDLAAGNTIQYHDGSVPNGKIVAGGAANVTNVNSEGLEQDAGQGAVVNWRKTYRQLLSTAVAYSQHAATDPVRRIGNSVSLTVTSTPKDGVAVFDLSSELLAKCDNLLIEGTGSGSLIVINVPDDSNAISNFGVTLTGTSPEHVLWNFYQTTSLSINSVGLQGSVLAPRAKVKFDNGNIAGNLYARSITGTGEYHLAPPVTPVCPPCEQQKCTYL